MSRNRKSTATPGTPSASPLTRYFTRNSQTADGLLQSKMAPPHVSLPASEVQASDPELCVPGQPGMIRAPASPLSPAQTPPPPMPPHFSGAVGLNGEVGSGDWRDLLSNLPTKADLQSMATSIVEALRQEVQDIKQQVVVLDNKVGSLETATSSIDSRLTALEAAHSATQIRLTTLFLTQDDHENRNRRNNLRLKGIPEATRGPDLRATVTAILNQLLNRSPTDRLELDRVHRVQVTRLSPSGPPRDVLCRVHFFTIKEEILRRAWECGTIDFDGAQIQVMPDLSRHTLRMRRLMKPLLDAVRSTGATYRWGHPFHLIVRRNDRTFFLHSPNNLPDLFNFLDTEAVDVPDWLDFPDARPASASFPSRDTRPQRRRERQVPDFRDGNNSGRREL